MIFVDTSALLEFLDRDAARHTEVVARSEEVFRSRRGITHSYALVETEALSRRRLGAAAARRFLEDVVPALEVVWVDAELHGLAVTAYLRAGRRRASLIDHVSFELMRRRSLTTALTLDKDFAREGFAIVPSG